MIRRKRPSLLGTLASATSILSATSASAILSIASAGLLLAASVSAHAQSTATVTITTAGTLDNISVLTQGATGLDYAAVVGGTCATGTAYAVNDTCTVKYSFTPTHPWVRYGGISLFDSAHHLLGNVFLNGVGTVPQVSYPLSAASTATALGSGASSPFGVAVDGSGNIYVADPSGPKVYELIAVNGVVPPTNPMIITLGSGFTSPSGVAVDGSGNVYVADTGGNAVKELVAVGGAVPATNPAIVPLATGYTFSQPKGIAVDSSGNVYVADTGNGVVVELKATDGVIPSTVTPTVLNGATNGFSQPSGVSVAASGDVYVADTGHSQVKKLAAVSGTVNPLSTPTTLPGSFLNVSGVAVDGSGDLYVAYAGGNVKEIVVGSGATIPLGSGFTALGGVTVDASGNVYVTDIESGHSLVKELNAQNPPPLTFASTAVGTTSSDSPETLTVANNGNAPLLFAVPTTGSNPSVGANFSISTSSTCPQLTSTSSAASLAVGASCTDVLSFTPTQGGSPLTDSLTTTDNASGSPHTVSLSGTATPAPTTLTLSPLTGSVGIDQSVNFTAMVAQSAGTVAPSGGTVRFSVTTTTASGTSAAVITPVTMTSGASFQFSYVPTKLGSFSVTAAYVANSNFQASTSSTSTQIVTQGNTSVTVTLPSTPQVDGSAIFTATVTANPNPTNAVEPSTGAVTFSAALSPSSSSIPLCTVASPTSSASAGLTATCTVSPLALPASATGYIVTATYAGSATFSGSTGSSSSFIVSKATPTVTVSGPATKQVNSPANFVATIATPAGTILPSAAGSVTFTASGGTPLPCSSASTAVATTNGFTYTCVVSALPLPASTTAYEVTASYGGDTNFATAQGTTLAGTIVTAGTTSVNLSASAASPIEAFQPVTFTATVTQNTFSGPIPFSGKVTFHNGTTAIPECPNPVAVTSSGVATCATTTLALGSNSITAAYNVDGTDTNFSGSTSTALLQTINQDNSTITVGLGSGATGTTSVDQQATFTATIKPDYFNATKIPSGTVSFSYGGALIPECQGALFALTGGSSQTYSANCATYSLPASGTGGNAITVHYAGDSTFSAPKPIGSPLLQVVTPIAVSVAVTSSQPTVVANQVTPPIFTATVTPVFAGTGSALPSGLGVALNGIVTFSVSGGDNSAPAPVCSAPVSTSGTVTTLTASCTFAFSHNQNNAKYNVSATYTSDKNFSPFTAADAFPETVQDFALIAPTTNSTASTAVPAPTAIFVTQGYNLGASSNNDPFFTATVNAAATPYGGFSNNLGFSATACAVQTFPNTSSAQALTCSGAATLSGGGAAISSAGFPLIFNTLASTVPGDYSVTLTATDASVTTLTRSTSPFTVTVVPQTTAQAILVNAAETVDASFTVPSPNDSYTFQCTQAHLVSSSSPITITSLPGGEGLYCSPVNSNGTLASNTASFRIGNPNAIGSATAKLKPFSTEFHTTLATALGLPLIAVAGCFGRRKYKGQRMVRLLGLALLIAGLSVATGCGSNGFTGVAYKPPTTALASGTYLIQVSATDTVTSKTYYSVVSVQLSAQ